LGKCHFRVTFQDEQIGGVEGISFFEYEDSFYTSWKYEVGRGEFRDYFLNS